MGRVGIDYIPWRPKAKPSDLFPVAYNFHLINSIDELREMFTATPDVIAFDTETTGLNAEENDIVGYSFCFDGKNAYYVPVNHVTGGLGDESLDIIYNVMCNAKAVFMFNMRFDTRMMEYHGYTTLVNKVKQSNKTKEEKEEIYAKLNSRQYIKYDMSKVNTIDVQAIVYLVDTNIKYPSLKKSEEWYLGWKGDTFAETIGEVENFYFLTPEESYFYAATDALGTFLLFMELKQYLEEARQSGELDYKSLLPLTRFENELTLIDVDRLKEYSKICENKILEVEENVRKIAGKKVVENKKTKEISYTDYNLGSIKDKNEMFKKLNIVTGEKTSNGSWSTSKDSIKSAIDLLTDKERRTGKREPSIDFLLSLQQYATYSKQKSSYIDNIIEMCDNELHPNRLRFSYKTTEVPTGRLAAGGDKKNQFFAAANIQNIPKPHVIKWFCERDDIVYNKYPELKTLLDCSGTREECYMEIANDEGNLDLVYFYRILNWIFSDKPFNIGGEVQEKQVEGFSQDLNIRSTFLPDDGTSWVSIDFNAEELRIPTLWSKEPVWLDAFKNNKDVHKETAISIWGADKYTKEKRKIAKSANFGILYGQDAKNFARDFNMPMEEAIEFVSSFKSRLAILFGWVANTEKEAADKGVVYTYFGRPRRVKFWMESDSWGLVSFGKRTAVNTKVQGTGADILKFTLIKIFNAFYKGGFTEYIRFKSTIHDEINYQVDKKVIRKIVPQILKNMRMQLPRMGVSYGSRLRDR